ncbi:hypothetical protein LBMAG56_04700 [Verrucomicrobiota bacterium]|nr:hypothetical protein LBMAG56_04700 [Verrucomicrobiota bacterium]
MCSVKGTLSFNADWIGMGRELGDYVIVHELLRCAVSDRGKHGKRLMRAHLGDYKGTRRSSALKSY